MASETTDHLERKESQGPDHGGMPLETHDTLCGIGRFKPRFLQLFARIGFFTAFNSVAYGTMSALISYVGSQVTTLERQFGLSSKQTSLVLISNDISYMICVMVTSFFGLGVFIMGLSGIVCTLPHFIYGSSTTSHVLKTDDNFTTESASTTLFLYGEMCNSVNSSLDQCGTSDEAISAGLLSESQKQVAFNSLVIFVAGMLLQGVGKGPRFTYAVTYIDNNTEKVNTGFHVGFHITLSIMAPVFSFLLGGLFTSIYVTLEDTELTPKHPKWIGAWWLGYLLFGTIAIIVSLPLFLFPRRLPRRKKQPDSEKVDGFENQRNALTQQSEKGTVPEGDQLLTRTAQTEDSAPVEPQERRSLIKKILYFVKECIATLIRLHRSPVYLLSILCGILSIFSVSGRAFRAKYLEIAFSLTAHEANYLMAITVLCSRIVGTFLGGYLSKRFKLTALTALRFTTINLILSWIAGLGGYIFYCDQPAVLNRPGSEYNCSSACDCEDNTFFPICGDDGETYYSPCHAGCLEVESKVYKNCSCIETGTAVAGVCDFNCSGLYLYLASAVLCSLFQTVTIIPKMIMYIRSVEPRDITAATAYHSFTSSLLGWLLGELLLGVAIDGVCDIWDISCGVTGRCLLYDNQLFRNKLHGYSTVALTGSILAAFVAWMIARYRGRFDVTKEQMIELKANGHTTDKLIK